MTHGDVCPTYQDVSAAVKSMKSGSSPCPFDALSIIIFKCYPILRTHLSNLIAACWVKRSVPRIWCRGVTTLIHKNGSTKEPANFRPITLQPIMSKILGACIRGKLWKYLDSNQMIDKYIQNGFWPGVAALLSMWHILKKQKRYSRDIYVVLLDLKNAFGEVHQSLLRFAF